MNYVDIAVIVICVLSTLVGFVRGFIASLFSTAGWILSIVGNHYLFNNIEPFLDAKFQSKILTFLVGYVGGLVILLLLFSILNFIVLSAISKFRTGFIDSFLGSLFGLVRGFLLIVIVFLCFETSMHALSDEKLTSLPEFLLDAKSLPLIKRGELMLIKHAPDIFRMRVTFSDMSDDITLLNLVRKLSTHISKSELEKINNSINKNSQYISKKQALIAKINALWKNYNNNPKQGETLSDGDIKIIQSLITND